MPEGIDFGQLSEKAFKMDVNILFSNGTGLDISSYLRRTRITNDYINYVMPQFRLVFTLPLEVAMLIQQDREQIAFSMEIMYAAVNLSEENKTSSDTKFYNHYMKRTVLKPLMMDDSIYNSVRTKNMQGSEKSQPESTNQVKFEMIAVPEDALKSNKYVTSGAYRNVNVTEAVLALTTRTNYKVQIVEPDNKELYDQIILYPGNIYSNLFHIHNTYGIYNDDLKVYSVNDRLIISPLNSDKVLDDRAPIDINVKFDLTNGDGAYYRGSYDEIDPNSSKTIKHIVTNYHSVSLQNNTGLIAEVFGNNNVITSRDLTGTHQEEHNQSYFDRHGEFNKARVYEDVYNNPYTRKDFINKIANQSILTITYKNIDLKLDDGLRKFIMNFDNRDYNRYNGNYKCLSTTHEFITQTKGLTTITGSITLRKV